MKLSTIAPFVAGYTIGSIFGAFVLPHVMSMLARSRAQSTLDHAYEREVVAQDQEIQFAAPYNTWLEQPHPTSFKRMR